MLVLGRCADSTYVRDPACGGLYWSAVATRPNPNAAKVRSLDAKKRAPARSAVNPSPSKVSTQTPAAKGATKATSRSAAGRTIKTASNIVPLERDEGAEGISGQLGQVIANHVRSRRLEIGLNVGQLAERTGISKGMLSKIENAQTSPSLSTLERLSLALDIPVTSLFRGLAEERDAVFVKAGSGPEIVRKGTRSGHTYELLGSLRGPYKRVEPLLVKLDVSTEVFPLFQHPGIEILYMLEGIMEYSYGREHYRMEKGDTLQFEGDIPHGPTELVKLPIRFLSITIYSGERA
jgi:transcriptional regulator with XRE-family HTH domain